MIGQHFYFLICQYNVVSSKVLFIQFLFYDKGIHQAPQSMTCQIFCGSYKTGAEGKL